MPVMKKLILFIALGVLAGVASNLAFAAYTKQTTRVARFQCDPVYNAQGVATSVPVQIFFANRVVVNDADASDIVNPGNFGPVNVDLMAAPVASTSYTFGGKTLTGNQIAGMLQTVFLAEATRQNIP